MTEAPSAPGAAERDRDRNPDELPNYGALDLGTNNCRLLIATPQGGSFRVVEAYSRIVRLGEGLSQSGRLSEAAMERALAAGIPARVLRTLSDEEIRWKDDNAALYRQLAVRSARTMREVDALEGLTPDAVRAAVQSAATDAVTSVAKVVSGSSS